MSSLIDNTNATFPGKVTAAAFLVSPAGPIDGVLKTVTPTGISYAALDTDDIILLTATGLTVTLPDATTRAGKVYTIKLTASGSGNIVTTSSQHIDAGTAWSLAAQYNSVTVVSDGTQWWAVAKV